MSIFMKGLFLASLLTISMQISFGGAGKKLPPRPFSNNLVAFDKLPPQNKRNFLRPKKLEKKNNNSDDEKKLPTPPIARRNNPVPTGNSRFQGLPQKKPQFKNFVKKNNNSDVEAFLNIPQTINVGQVQGNNAWLGQVGANINNGDMIIPPTINVGQAQGNNAPPTLFNKIRDLINNADEGNGIENASLINADAPAQGNNARLDQIAANINNSAVRNRNLMRINEGALNILENNQNFDGRARNAEMLLATANQKLKEAGDEITNLTETIKHMQKSSLESKEIIVQLRDKETEFKLGKIELNRWLNEKWGFENEVKNLKDQNKSLVSELNSARDEIKALTNGTKKANEGSSYNNNVNNDINPNYNNNNGNNAYNNNMNNNNNMNYNDLNKYGYSQYDTSGVDSDISDYNSLYNNPNYNNNGDNAYNNNMNPDYGYNNNNWNNNYNLRPARDSNNGAPDLSQFSEPKAIYGNDWGVTYKLDEDSYNSFLSDYNNAQNNNNNPKTNRGGQNNNNNNRNNLGGNNNNGNNPYHNN